MPEQLVGTVEELGPGSVRGIGGWAVLNVNGERCAVSRRCRHLRADLANGKIDEDGCLVCPWHQSRYDPTTGRMVVGPQAGFMGGIACLLSGIAPSSSKVESPRIPGRFKTPKWWRAQHAPPHRQVVTSELARNCDHRARGQAPQLLVR